MIRNIRAALAVPAAVAVLALMAGTPAIADYYANKTVRIIHAGSAQGSYAIYTRIFVRHFGKHLPGNPNVVAEFNPGAGGLNAQNHVYNVAPKDGTVLLMPLPGVVTAPLLSPAQTRFDPAKFVWLGHITQLQSAVGVWKNAPATTIEQARTTEVILGASGKTSELALVPQLMNAVLGTKFKIIMGYNGMGGVNLAMENGEVHGRGGAMTAWHPLKPDWFQPENRIAFLAQLGMTRHPAIPDVPLMTEFATNEDDRKVLELAARATVLSRAVAAPPDTEAARVPELRAAFEATMKDPEYLADMEKQNMLMIEPMTWQQIDVFVSETQNTPKHIQERLVILLGTGS